MLETLGTAGGRICTYGVNAFGLFPKKMVDACLAQSGGNACYSARWSVGMVRRTLGL